MAKRQASQLVLTPCGWCHVSHHDRAARHGRWARRRDRPSAPRISTAPPAA